MADFDPNTSYRSASGDIIVIRKMRNENLVFTYKVFLNRYKILERIKADIKRDPTWPDYLKRFAQVRDLLKEEIKFRGLKMKDY